MLSFLDEDRRSALFSTGRRDATEVAYQILMLARDGVSRNQIVQHVNLNFQMANRYVSQLAAKDLIQRRMSDASAERYELTARGEKVFRLLSEVENELVRPNRTARSPSVPVPTKLVPNGGTQRLDRIPAWGQSVRKIRGISRPVQLLPYMAGFLAGFGLGYFMP